MPIKRQWKQFLSIFLLAAGVGFTVAGIIFFFAYNWEDLPKFAKLGIVQTLLVASVLLTVFTRWNILIKQIILTGATFLVGTLFAVFGQIYQTGADAYDLFLGWTLFTILWAFAIRFTPIWLMFIGLLCTTIWLYAMQIVPDNQWASHFTDQCSNLDLRFGNGRHRMDEYQRYPQPTNRWFVSLLSLATIVHVTYLMMAVICEKDAIVSIPSQVPFCCSRQGVMVRMETKEFILSFRHSFCHTDDFADYPCLSVTVTLGTSTYSSSQELLLSPVPLY